MQTKALRPLAWSALAVSLLAVQPARAIDWNVTGFVRQEISVGFGAEHEFNDIGNPYQARVMPALTANPANGTRLRSNGVNGGPALPTGQSSADYVAFALQQPFPDLIWRFDTSMLVDLQGGYLVQTGLR